MVEDDLKSKGEEEIKLTDTDLPLTTLSDIYETDNQSEERKTLLK